MISNYRLILNKETEKDDYFSTQSQHKAAIIYASDFENDLNNKCEYEYKSFLCYFYPEIESLIDPQMKEILLKEMTQFSEHSEFFKNRKIGENDSFICSLIRDDLIDEFIPYITRKNFPFSSLIAPSIFETNRFLNKNFNQTSLIEYAAFYGSIQIFNYLRLNDAVLNQYLWLYAIHGKNVEIIHLLEENEVKPPKKDYNFCFVEAIKCHHDDIAEYIQQSKCLNSTNTIKTRKYRYDQFNQFDFDFDFMFNRNFNTKLKTADPCSYSFKSHNYKYMQKYLSDKLVLFNSCKYDYYSFVSFHKNEKMINNEEIPKLIKTTAKNNNMDIVNLLLEMPLISIEDRYFSGLKKMTKIIIPNSKTTIGNGAFENCESLFEVQLPSSLVSIKSNAFDKCFSIKEIVIPSSVTELGKFCFCQCKSLTHVKILASITELLQSTFDGCISLVKVELPSSLNKIDCFCFNMCSSLIEIDIPSSVNNIEKGAFNECSSLKIIKINGSLNEIKDNTFYNCSSLIEIVIPSSVSKICKNAFFQCSSLKQISIPASVVNIEMNVFANCSSLEKVIFLAPSSLNYVGSRSFEQCKSLKEIDFPSSISSFGCNVLSGCSSLEQITILKSVDLKRLGVENSNIKINCK